MEEVRTMTPLATGFLIAMSVLLLVLPRRWAPVPLLLGACYMTLGQGFMIGPFHFTVIRVLIAVGVIRVLTRGERIDGGMIGMDWLMLALGAAALWSSMYHEDPRQALIFRSGFTYNSCGIYFLIRVLCQSIDDVVRVCRILAILLIPMAAEMVVEKFFGYNAFSIFGGVPSTPNIRTGKIRAQGAFVHSILAGTVGAVTLPLMVGLWKTHRRDALLGIGACLGIVATCHSSGPILSATMAIVALFAWRFRYNMRAIRWLLVLGYIALDIVMKAPAYYLIARFDLTGGSTGWHRAELLRSALAHIGEWWFAGTDYTRHWMPTGVTWSANHTDITNYYLTLGVLGGLPLMLVFIAILVKGYSYIGRTMRVDLPVELHFLAWCLGSCLFAHTATSLSVAYFDQSFLFIYSAFAFISCVWSEASRLEAMERDWSSELSVHQGWVQESSY